MNSYKRRKRFSAKMARILLVILCVQTFFPADLLALTSGPSQPEFSEFEPVGTTDMVDLFSGDFVYNIPLFELPGPDGGYPFNLSYHSGVTMDQEATWVGLGWTMNHGAINRTMRGFPDDFNGDDVEQRMNMEPNRTWTLGLEGHFELLGFDLKNDTPLPPALGASLGLKVSHNNYRGIGLSTTFGLSTNFVKGDKEGNYVGNRGSASLGLSFGSEDGANISGGLSIGDVKSKNRVSLSFGKSGREGMQSLSLGYTRKLTVPVKNDKGEKVGSKVLPISPTASYTYTKSAYSPQVSLPYRGMYFTGAVETGLYPGIFLGAGPEINVSFNRQRLKNNNRWTKAPAFGYFHLTADPGKGLSDFNREKDGPIYDNTPNLANPITTPDIYSVTGQGTGGMYRAYRSDIGILSDAKVTSLTGGGKLGIDINALAGVDGGADIGGNFAISSTGRWDGPGSYNFDPRKNSSKNFEPFYFKAAGEMTAEPESDYNYIGNEEALHLNLDNSTLPYAAPGWETTSGSALVKGTTSFTPLGSTNGVRSKRKPRSNSIQYITNGQLLGPTDEESLNEYKITYLNASGNEMALERPTDKPDQFAGMTALQPNGMRYVYGLPVMNLEQHEVSFSVNQFPAGNCSVMNPTTSDYNVAANNREINAPTDAANGGNYLSHSRLPEYAHAYLLTSVLGADYVDLDDVPGPSDGDYGYWVKFNYIQTSSDTDPYIWKTPFEDANFIAGNFADQSDDKGMIVAGSREQYYLASAETRTHRAEFDISTRTDARGAAQLFQQASNKDAYSYKLNSIKLFSKLEVENTPTATPIKTVLFKYAGDAPYQNVSPLCDNIDNGSNGKLTLKSVHFEYENSTRGSLSPYEFDYDEENALSNPDYSELDYDRWGTYKGMSDNCERRNYPYAEQNKTIADRNARAWSLSQVKLPSGATINVNYESDDYAYVQDEVAMQMFDLVRSNGSNSGNFDIEVRSMEDIDNDAEEIAARTIYFELENSSDDINKYIDGLHGVTTNPDGTLNLANAQMYFKVFADMNNSGEDYVKGYARIESFSASGGVGEIVLAPVELNGKNYHPFAAAAWQHLKINYPRSAMDEVPLNQDENNFLEALDALGAAFGQAKAVFSNFWKYCSSNGFGDFIELDQSYVRLCSSDRIKLGGGCRVQQITLQDNWDIGEDGNADASTYGQFFEYTKESGELDDNGDPIIISSGVAANEPATGYDECALRYAKVWNNRNSLLASDENLMFEYPINETYYPGASVGYSKVTVKSLATHFAMNPQEAPSGLPQGFGTTGVTVSEFYTAKDFPVITKETTLEKEKGAPKALLLGLVNLTFDAYTGSQGYTIILNDMHGKPFKTTHYGLDQDNNFVDQKLSEVIYTYSEGEPEVNDTGGRRKTIRTLDNKVPVLRAPYKSQVNPEADVVEQLLGVDYETFMDMRESWSSGTDAGVGLNAKFTPPFFFGFAGWPRMTMNNSRTRTAVTNKIVRKTGIMVKTDAYDGQSHITTSNEVFDPLTGEPLLTSVNNSFDDKVYNYNIPARFAYDRMGAAYENWGLQFSGTLSVDASCGYIALNNTSGDVTALVRGDECIMTGFTDNENCNDHEDLCNSRKFIYVGEVNGKHCFENPDLNTINGGVRINMMVLRSGKRNHLSAKSGNIAALSNPLEGREPLSIIPFTIPTPTGGEDIQASINRIDNVLNASAVTYSDAWDLERELTYDTVTVIGTPSSGCECLYASFDYSESGGVPPANTVVQVTYQTNGGNTMTYIIDPLPTGQCSEVNPVLDNCEKIACSSNGFNNSNWTFVTTGSSPPPTVTLSVESVAGENCTTGGGTCNCLYGSAFNSAGAGCGYDWSANYTINGVAYSNMSPVANEDNNNCPIGGNPSSSCVRFVCSNQSISNAFTTVTATGNNCTGNIFHISQVVSEDCEVDDGVDPPTGGGQQCVIVDFDDDSVNGGGSNICATYSVSYTVDGVTYNTGGEGSGVYTIYCGPLSENITVSCSANNAETGPLCGGNPTVDCYVEIQPGEPVGTEEDVVLATPSYSIGQLGIWRPHKSYTYVENRTPENLTTNQGDLNIQQDGIFDNLVLFDWQNPFFTQLPIASNWKQTNEITKYSRNGEEVENRDIIGLYSSALYGYNDNLPVGVAANAAHQEIGFESFEEFTLDDLYATNNSGNGNLNFICRSYENTVSLTYNVLGAYVSGNTIWIDKEGYSQLPVPDNAFLLLQDEQGNEYEAAAGVTGISSLDPSTVGLTTFFREDVCELNLTDIQSCNLPSNSILTGRVVLQYDLQYYSVPPDGKGCGGRMISNAEAHSGKYSLALPSETVFAQKDLQLITGRKYVLSTWVKAPHYLPVHTYDPDIIYAKVYNEFVEVGSFEPKGEIIEGWQRIEGVFTYNGGEVEFELGANAGANEYCYYDDIRIYPEDGSFQTYVYNPDDYRLQAVLDQNNYATFYQYDEEGNLFLIKKETAKGIKTIQETREFVKDTSNP